MPAVRGMRRGKYVTDSAAEYQRRVDDDFYQNANMGWTDGAGLVKMPQGLRPRHVTGLSATTGRRSTVVVASVGANLWTGVVTSWTGGTNIQTTDTYTVIDKINEKPSS
jgi:hypothetical protein